jgi:predicted nucleotidyltransferase
VKQPRTDFLSILRILSEHQVDFIVVGGLGAVLQGAPIATFDLDLVHSRTPANIDRLMRSLEALDASYRGQAGRTIRPTPPHLATPGHQLLMTLAGPLDLLGVIGKGRGYDELLAHTVELEVGAGVRVRVLDLATLIETKEEAGRDKDRAVLAILRRTLEQTKR